MKTPLQLHDAIYRIPDKIGSMIQTWSFDKSSTFVKFSQTIQTFEPEGLKSLHCLLEISVLFVRTMRTFIILFSVWKR